MVVNNNKTNPQAGEPEFVLSQTKSLECRDFPPRGCRFLSFEKTKNQKCILLIIFQVNSNQLKYFLII